MVSKCILSGIVITVAALVGCTRTEPPAFRLDMPNVVEKQISTTHQKAMANILAAMFGTPDKPFAMPETGLNQRKLTMAAGPVWSDVEGRKHGLYRRHCAHCHGISGDGHGPTAGILNPYPRDYRRGIFKFKGTQYAARPSDDDLRKTLLEGIPGTAMPAFALLPPDEVDALVEYVKYLSIRGQMEAALADYVFNEAEPEDTLDPATNAELKNTLVNDLLAIVISDWQDAANQVIVPDDSAIPPADRTPEQIVESIAKGRELFNSTTKGNCMQCHGPTSLGDGQTNDFDDWTKTNNKFVTDTDDLLESIQEQKTKLGELTGEERQEAVEELDRMQLEYVQRRELVRHLLPSRNAIPRNLRAGVFRGGRRPLDIFWRIYAGIPGVPMPGSAQTVEGGPGLTQEEVWQVVDYVQSLPFEPASRPLKRPTNVGIMN